MKFLLALAAALLATILSSGPASAAERLLFPSRADRTAPWLLEFADPVGGGAQSFATSPLQLLDPTWSHDHKTVSFYEYAGRGLLLKPATGSPESPFLSVEAVRPSWSPVAAEIAYWEATEPWKYVLKVTTTDGRTTRPVAGPFDPRVDMPLAGLEQPAWSPDGKTLAFALRRGISTVPAAGGPVTQLVAGGPARTFFAHEPSFAPDSKQFAFIKTFDDQFGSFTSWQLVVRDLQGGPDKSLANGSSTPGDLSSQAHGPQSWSPDSKAIAFTEQRTTGISSPTHEGSVNIVRSDGSGRRTIARRYGAGAPAWGGGGPNYYVKHIEVAQAIAPDLGPLRDVDPLASEIPFRWTLPSVAGFSIPLVAEKSTLVRIYVGDATLTKGTSQERYVRFSVTGPGLSQPVERVDNVRVTASDVAPSQSDRVAALNVWLPPSLARSGSPVRLDVELNTGQAETECDGCHPKGNKAFLDGMLFEDGGDVVLAPVPIYVVAPDLTFIAPKSDIPKAWPFMTPMLPIGDSSLRTVSSPASLAVMFDDMLAKGDDRELASFWPCGVLLTRLEELRLLSPSPVSPSGAFRWVGFSDHPLARSSCGGKAYQPGQSILVTESSPSTGVHELGHSLGLRHTLGYGPKVAANAEALPYIGIGGVGYKDAGSSYLIAHDKLKYGDVMSYSPSTWTSPATWHRMFESILAESGPSASAAAAGRPSTTASATVGRKRSRRLVSGFFADRRGVLLRSVAANAAKPANSGRLIGRVVARDRRGRRVATAKVRTRAAVAGETQPFMVTLPASRRIVSLELLRPAGGKSLDRIKASKHAPKARFVRLPRRVSAKRKLTVRWRASDADRNQLSVTVLARRGSKPWDTVAMGPARFKASIDPRTLGRGKRLRLRLLVSDGFHTTITARSLGLEGDPMQRWLATSFVAATAAICMSNAPASAEMGPPCGSDQLEVKASVGTMYATHVYEVALEIGREAPTRDHSAFADNVQVTGPGGVVRLVRDDDTVVVAPQVAGGLPLTVSWEQAAHARGAPPCVAATTLELPVQAPLPVTLARYRRGTRAYFESWPCGGAATCRGARGNRFGIFFYLAAGKRDPSDGYDWEAADLTPVRVEARAAAGAKRPSPAVEPAVLEFAPLARQPRRAKQGLVEIVRRRGGEVVEIWVAARPGFFRRGLSFSFSQGPRSLGSFTAAGRCYSSSSFGAPSTNCDFKGRHSWLWAPCREAVLIRGEFMGCRK